MLLRVSNLSRWDLSQGLAQIPRFISLLQTIHSDILVNYLYDFVLVVVVVSLVGGGEGAKKEGEEAILTSLNCSV